MPTPGAVKRLDRPQVSAPHRTYNFGKFPKAQINASPSGSTQPPRKKVLDKLPSPCYTTHMKEITKISPEGLEIANAYLEKGSLKAVCADLQLRPDDVQEILNKREVKAYIDQVYLDQGYRNRFRLSQVLDDIIDEKLSEAQESGMFSNKDLADLLQMAHKMRMDELKIQVDLEKAQASNIRSQTNVQINELPFGQGNYGKLMEKLLGNSKGE